MAYTYNKDIADTANNKVNPCDLRSEIESSVWTYPLVGVRVKGTYQSDGTLINDPVLGSLLDITFNQSLPGGDVTQLDGIISAHQGAAAVIRKLIAIIKIFDGTRSVTESTWVEIGGIVVDFSSITGGENSFAVLTGAWHAAGNGADLRIVEETSGGDNVLGTISAADTSGKMVPFQLQTDTQPTSGLRVFKVEVQKDTAETFDVRYLTLSLYNIRIMGA